MLRVGAPPSVMLSALPAVIRKYRRLYPAVTFALREMSTSAIEDALRAGEIDLGFLRETIPEAPLLSEVVFDEAVVAVLPAAHPLAEARDLKLVALRDEQFVFFPRRLGEAFYDRMISFCGAAGFVPMVVQEATQWQSIVCLVEAGMGTSIAPACVQRFRWAGVAYRPLRGLRTNVSICWSGDEKAATAAAFLKLARSAFR